MSIATEHEAVLAELRTADKLLLTTHENPDGDALGSLLAMHWILEQLGKQSVMYMSPDEFPLPWEYRAWTFDGIAGAPPADVAERTIVFLDCGNIDRMPVDFLQQDGLHILNIDHHHDNTRFGTVNLVVPEASCTAEIVYRLAKDLGVEITPPIADALYTGLVTDTGKFMYENTTAEAHRMAAELIEFGVEPHEVHRRLYEDLPFRRLQLLAARAGQRRAPRRGHDHGGSPGQGRLRRHGSHGAGLRGRGRPHARRRGNRRGGAGAGVALRRPRWPAQGEPAGHRRASRRLAGRTRLRWRGSSAGSRLLDPLGFPELVERLRRLVREQLQHV